MIFCLLTLIKNLGMAELITIWQNPDAPTSKFFASICMYRLSRVLDRKHFEPVVEGYLDLQDPEAHQADLVVYDKHRLYKCVLLVHFTGESAAFEIIPDMISNLQKYKIEEGFLYDTSNGEWLKIFSNGEVSRNSYSQVIGTSLDGVLMEGLDLYRA